MHLVFPIFHIISFSRNVIILEIQAATKTIVVITTDRPSDKKTTSKMRKIKFLMGNLAKRGGKDEEALNLFNAMIA